jgi:hypothetical protein
MSVDRKLDQIRLLLAALTEFVVDDFKVVLGMKRNRVDFGGDFDRCASDGHMNVLDALLGRDKYVLPIFELFRPRPELDKPSTITAHSVGERRGFLDLPLRNQLIGEILQRHAPSDMEQVARRIDCGRLDEIGWGHQPFG